MNGIKKTKQKLHLISYYYPFNRSPALQNLSRDLACDYDLSIIVDHRYINKIDPDLLDITIPYENINKIQKNYYSRNLLKNILPKYITQIASSVITIKEYLIYLPKLKKRISSIDKSSIILAADKGSLFALIIAGRMPEIYYSLEASPLLDEPNLLFKFLNIIEWLFIKIKNPYVISQSVTRADLVQKNRDKQIIIPVTSTGNKIEKNNYVRTKYKIDKNKILILIAGGIGEDQLTPEIVNVAQKWTGNLVLFIHSASKNYPEYLTKSALKYPDKIVISNEELTIEESEKLVYASADVGLVFYKDLGFNYQNTAYSSSKLASFLKTGVPVITSEFIEFEKLITKFGFGKCSSIDKIQEASCEILKHYNKYADNAYKAYDEVYDYKNYKGKVSSLIKKIQN